MFLSEPREIGIFVNRENACMWIMTWSSISRIIFPISFAMLCLVLGSSPEFLCLKSQCVIQEL